MKTVLFINQNGVRVGLTELKRFIELFCLAGEWETVKTIDWFLIMLT